MLNRQRVSDAYLGAKITDFVEIIQKHIGFLHHRMQKKHRNFAYAFAVWYDYVLAVLWFIMVFWFCFRSPLYWGLGKKDGYELPDQTAFGQWEKRVLNR